MCLYCHFKCIFDCVYSSSSQASNFKINRPHSAAATFGGSHQPSSRLQRALSIASQNSSNTGFMSRTTGRGGSAGGSRPASSSRERDRGGNRGDDSADDSGDRDRDRGASSKQRPGMRKAKSSGQIMPASRRTDSSPLFGEPVEVEQQQRGQSQIQSVEQLQFTRGTDKYQFEPAPLHFLSSPTNNNQSVIPPFEPLGGDEDENDDPLREIYHEQQQQTQLSSKNSSNSSSHHTDKMNCAQYNNNSSFRPPASFIEAPYFPIY